MKLSITQLTRTTKPLTDALVRGETIILTRQGKDFGVISPFKGKAKSPLEIQAEKAFYRMVAKDNRRIEEESPKPNTSKCEIPPGNCKVQGQQYLVTFMSDEGEEKKLAHLCPIHKRALVANGTEVQNV